MLILSAKLAMSFNGLEILKTQTMAAMVSSGWQVHCNLVHGIVGFASSFEFRVLSFELRVHKQRVHVCARLSRFPANASGHERQCPVESIVYL